MKVKTDQNWCWYSARSRPLLSCYETSYSSERTKFCVYQDLSITLHRSGVLTSWLHFPCRKGLESWPYIFARLHCGRIYDGLAQNFNFPRFFSVTSRFGILVSKALDLETNNLYPPSNPPIQPWEPAKALRLRHMFSFHHLTVTHRIGLKVRHLWGSTNPEECQQHSC